MPHVLLGLGANLGDRLSSLEKAVAALSTLGPVRRSSWYETEPVGMPGAPLFLNGAVSLDTRLGPEELFEETRKIEEELGRARTNAECKMQSAKCKMAEQVYSSRTIDIDILFYGHESIELPGLHIPHPQFEGRAFVLVPLAEIEPDFRHPGLGASVAELAMRAGTAGVRKAA